MGRVLSRLLYQADAHRYFFECPGCETLHFFTTDPDAEDKWSWNNDPEKPTVTPSILINGSRPEARCHFWLTEGKLVFLSDCFHHLKNQTVPMIEHNFGDKD